MSKLYIFLTVLVLILVFFEFRFVTLFFVLGNKHNQFLTYPIIVFAFSIISLTALHCTYYYFPKTKTDKSWRLAPSVTETRDGYLTKTMKRIEKLHDDNDNLPIVLCCHSMVRVTNAYTNNSQIHK